MIDLSDMMNCKREEEEEKNMRTKLKESYESNEEIAKAHKSSNETSMMAELKLVAYPHTHLNSHSHTTKTEIQNDFNEMNTHTQTHTRSFRSNSHPNARFIQTIYSISSLQFCVFFFTLLHNCWRTKSVIHLGNRRVPLRVPPISQSSSSDFM